MSEITDKDIAKASSTSLVNYIVAYKLLNYNKPLAIKCMVELDRRRNAGDELNYEDLVEEKLKEWKAKVPKPLELKSPMDFAKILANKDD